MHLAHYLLPGLMTVLVVTCNKTTMNDPKTKRQIEANTPMDISILAHEIHVKNNDQ